MLFFLLTWLKFFFAIVEGDLGQHNQNSHRQLGLGPLGVFIRLVEKVAGKRDLMKLTLVSVFVVSNRAFCGNGNLL
jgi:hypothetical protein